MHFLSKLLQERSDEAVHRIFLRYGRGNYDGPATNISFTSKGKIKVKSTYLYQDLIAATLVKVVPVDTMSVSGLILGYEQLDEALADLGISAAPFKKKRRTRLYQTKISGDYSKEQIRTLYEDIGEKAFIFCNLSPGEGWAHKSKTKLPSAQKEPDVDERLRFSSTKVPPGTMFIDELLQELAPDFMKVIPESFKTLRLENIYAITEMVFPADKEQLSSAELRRNTKRKGTLHRKLTVDGLEHTQEHPFLA